MKNIIEVLESSVSAQIDDQMKKIISNNGLTDEIVLQSSMSAYFPFWATMLQRKLPGNQAIILVYPNDEQAYHASENVKELMQLSDKHKKNSPSLQNYIYLPSWNVSSGTGIAQFASIRSARASSLYKISQASPNLLFCSIDQWNRLLPAVESLKNQIISLKKGDAIDPTMIAETLVRWNFLRVPHVSNEGEFAMRGEVLDIFISKNTNATNISMPVRITFDFEHIEAIKTFDVYSQMTAEHLDEILLHPRTEFVWENQHITQLTQNIRKNFPEISTTIVEKTIDTLNTHGYDEWDYLYGALAYEKNSHIIDYFETPPMVFLANYEMLHKQDEFFWNKERELFLSYGHIQCIPRHTKIEPILREKRKTLTCIKVFRTSNIESALKIGDKDTNKFGGNIAYFTKYVQQKHEEEGTMFFIACDDETHQERITLLIKGTLASSVLGEQENHSKLDFPVEFIKSYIDQGFISSAGNLELYSEQDLLGKKLHHFDSSKSSPIESIQQIEPDDLVVHVQYGIGKFVELTRMNLNGVEKDFIKLMYAGEESLYVPIEQLNMVQRYVGQLKEHVSLDAIGGKAWQKRKEQAQKKIEDISGQLLETHAKRSAQIGFQFLSGDEWEKEFIDAFPFDETDDQIRVWEEISEDMASSTPMDRLVVGDVGFGKTELAFRAAFRAITAGKQAAMLVPTTILAEQHYFSAVDRFSKFPVRIAMLSRFLSTQEQKKVIAELKAGTVDFIIGTHRIIQKDIEYKDLGLCIIDEEHRFGVKHKEFIKKYRDAIDCLSLSATPIPRTLYQSIVQLRDMSVLTTAPKKRKPIKTFVEKFDENLISKAIITEIDRGGQVFYLHNRISTLEEVQRFIEKLVPQATVVIANGQMSAKALEDTMYRFVNKGANVLVSTTIIENGIDIPNVNTIIIDRADNYGISQLYQLRGRVGRSDQTAFAYLMYPDEMSISEIALKRLSTISDNSELGAGFQIAMRDLEVRGSGNLLGKEQSGTIFAIGYEHYIKMLDDTMKRMKGVPSPPEPMLELSYTGFIPNTYISDNLIKLEVYKQIVSVKNIEEYNLLLNEIKDKYGDIPQEVLNLFWIAKLKILCASLHISYLKEGIIGFELHFTNMKIISNKNVVTLMQAGKVTFNQKKGNVLIIPVKKSAQLTLQEKYFLVESCLTTIIEK